MKRQVKNQSLGFRTKDGAGVKLVRVLGHDTTDPFDPILMLDSFDSANPEDYIKGFPLHPHRGIETISYLKHGHMVHKDTLGNEDEISDGQVQWMTAGSGILHEEQLPASPRVLGVQLWLNLPKDLKMTKPFYHSLKDLPARTEGPCKVEIISGSFKGTEGFKAPNHPLDYYSIEFLDQGSISLASQEEDVVILFSLLGSFKLDGQVVEEKTAITTSPGTETLIEADKETIVLYLKTKRLDEPVAWAGPIVMNTQEELKQARKDLELGTFLKEQANYEVES